ncbi:hypothetical protein BC937DRAFT_94376, partial [Endogone sp. FLAS-F59071]
RYVIFHLVSKPFTAFTFAQVCHLYEIGNLDDDPELTVFPVSLRRATDFHMTNDSIRSLYSEPFLVAAVCHSYEREIILRPQKMIRERNGNGPVDISFESRRTGAQVGVTEIKKENTIHSGKKRKRDDDNNGKSVELKRSSPMSGTDKDAKIQYQLSERFTIDLQEEFNEGQVKMVLEHIVWLLSQMKEAEEEVAPTAQLQSA